MDGGHDQEGRRTSESPAQSAASSRWRPGGSNHFDETADIIEVFIDDIRQLDTRFKSVARVTRQGSAAVMPRWLLDSDDKRGLLELIGDEGTAKGGNPKGHPRRFVEPDE